MYSKCFHQLLKKLLYLIISFIIKMYNSDSDDLKRGIDRLHRYAFKLYDYQEIYVSYSTEDVPYKRSGHRIGADSANFYSFGGYNPIRNDDDFHEEDVHWNESYPLFRELWRFNFASKRWTQYPVKESLPSELASNAVLLHRNLLMVYGGTGSPFGFRCSNQLYICNVNNKTGPMVEIITTGHLPQPLYGQALVYDNDYLYTIGGTTGLSYTCDIHRLNMKTFVWEAMYICHGHLNSEPEGRYRHEVGFDGRLIYILGGGTADRAYGFEQIPAFDVEKRHWIWKKSIKDTTFNRRGVPSPRRCHAAVQIKTEAGDQVFIIGGHDGTNIFKDIWRLDLKTCAWTYFQNFHLRRPTYFHSAAATPEGRLYIFGGIYLRSDDVARSNSIFSAWLVIPKLSEMCWEAILHYSPHIVDKKSDDLINVGFPKRFVQRLEN